MHDPEKTKRELAARPPDAPAPGPSGPYVPHLMVQSADTATSLPVAVSWELPLGVRRRVGPRRPVARAPERPARVARQEVPLIKVGEMRKRSEERVHAAPSLGGAQSRRPAPVCSRTCARRAHLAIRDVAFAETNHQQMEEASR